MTKLSYYLCTTQTDKDVLMYGTSKKEIIKNGEEFGHGNFKNIQEQCFNELKLKYDEKVLDEIRKNRSGLVKNKLETKVGKV